MKKATGTITFRCNQGKEISATIQKSIETGEGQTIEALTVSTDELGDVVAEFLVNWSFKVKS
jgi:4-hydroxyphenylpyruvate dioxygenase-like putative hemolysin